MIKDRLAQFSRYLFSPLDIMPLVFFRVAFGGLMLWEVWRYFHYNRIFRYYIAPEFNFHYYGFHWITPLAGDGMIWLFHFMGVLSVCIILGIGYRVVMTVFWLTFTYIFLLDQANYLNHFYLVCLVSFLLIFVPAHRKWSVDALLRPKIRAEVAPVWSLWLLRGQMTIVYVFGGIAKINPDWLLGEPMRDWLSSRTDFPLIGQYFTEEWMVYGFSYGGLLFDLFIVPVILWRRTRLLGLVLMFGFHLTNIRLFNIGIFPYFAMAATLIYLPPDWFRFWRRTPITEPTPAQSWRLYRPQFALLTAVAVYVVVQMALPLRHFLYPGYVSWSEAGHNLAWHMKLRSKDGEIAFYASNPADGFTEYIPLGDYLSSRQIREMADNPQMILRLAHHLATLPAYQDHEIRVWAMMTLNSRAPQLMIDPTANLVAERDKLGNHAWILPIRQPTANHTGYPMALVSRRHDGVLTLINMTDVPFPLERLQLHDGETTITGRDFNLPALSPDGCVVAHQPQADMQAVFSVCTEEASRLVLPSQGNFWQSDQSLQVNEPYRITCEATYCIVTFEGDVLLDTTTIVSP